MYDISLTSYDSIRLTDITIRPDDNQVGAKLWLGTGNLKLFTFPRKSTASLYICDSRADC